MFFLIPYERDFTLIGTTDEDFIGDPADVRASAVDIAYLPVSASAYLREPITPEMVVWSYSGVRPLTRRNVRTTAGDPGLRAKT